MSKADRNPVQVIRIASEGKSMAFALRSGNYPDSIARNPQRFLNNESFIKDFYCYLEEHPEEIENVVKSIKAGLNATTRRSLPDHARQLFFLDLALKLKGYF